MKELIQQYLAEVEAFASADAQEIETFRVKFAGRKGILNDLFEQFKQVPGPEKKETGMMLNRLKESVMQKVEELRSRMMETEEDTHLTDLTLPVDFYNMGSRHPLSIVRNRIISIFSRIGFTVAEGPEIEDDWHNFSALNFTPDHPARDMQDTFFIEKRPGGNDVMLRTHTSSVQVRVMEKNRPPIRMIFPGRVFRNEAISARAHCIFHQVEGLYVDRNVSFVDLKQTLLYFAREMFGEKTQIRLRPSYFPFTEPSAEMDISCPLCGGKGCNICKYTGWIEILGCGMVDPAVLDACGIDSEAYTGFAFGMGIERMTMGLYQIKDLRLFFENDLRFLRQFESAF
ncbi:MAG: phenylalanine--tRNA ligase subunit alpha [Bacteroidales bacterium]